MTGENNPLDNPVVKDNISKLQAGYDRKIADLVKANEKLSSDLDKVLNMVDETEGEDSASKLSKRLSSLKETRVKEQSSREVSEAQRIAGLASKAREFALQFKDHGVHMEDLMEYSSEAEMLSHCLNKGMESLAKAKETSTDGTKQTDSSRVYTNTNTNSPPPSLTTAEKFALGLKERGLAP